MLIPNLPVLLAERRLTISKVSEDTRISRTTLTALCGGAAKGAQFDTLNALCQYLKITPGELFLYRPYDLSLSAEGLPGRSTVTVTVARTGGVADRFPLLCDAEYRYTDGTPPTLEGLRVRLSLPPAEDPAQAARNDALLSLLRDLPRPALSDLELELLRAFDRHISPALAPNDYTPDVRWPCHP